MANSSINKVDVTSSRSVSLAANTELTVKFNRNIQMVSIVNLGTSNIYFRSDGNLSVINDDNCMKLDASFKGFDLYSATPFSEISFIADANVKIQLLNIR